MEQMDILENERCGEDFVQRDIERNEFFHSLSKLHSYDEIVEALEK